MASAENRQNTKPQDPAVPATLEEQAADLDRVRHELETTLGWAQKRIDFYAAVDAAVQTSVAEALRHAAEIKSQTEQEAKTILDRVAAEKAALVAEIESMRQQRTVLQQEVAEMKREAEKKSAEILKKAKEEAASTISDAEARKAAILAEIATIEKHLSEVGIRVGRSLGSPVQDPVPESDPKPTDLG